MARRRVLVTGAMGRVVQQLLPGLRERFDVRLMDRVTGSADASDSDVFVGELTDRRLLDDAVKGVDAVVHLAGNPDPAAPW
jgi:NAD+ dependent glucose-6-phosphate dehydrogenase